MFWDIVSESLRGAVLISGLVIVMMMLIESLDVSSHGGLLRRLSASRTGQVVISAMLGAIPGCMGGYATVSLYTHGAMSFGALVAMMIATCGDETFVMLAMFPGKALAIMAFLLALAIAAGLLTDRLIPASMLPRLDKACKMDGVVPDTHGHGECGDAARRHPGWRRMVLLAAVTAFIAALASGALGHDGGTHAHDGGLNLLSEDWMNILFAGLSLVMIAVIARAPDSFVDGQLWRHIVCRHFPRTFAWTFGILVMVGLLTGMVDISGWIGSNTALMVVLAVLVGIIPESGPHLIFVTLYAGGILPLPVLLASSIAQDGHACLPLLAESPRSFALAKAINCALGLCVGFAAMLLT